MQDGGAAGVGIEMVEPFIGADPQLATAIIGDDGDTDAAETARAGRDGDEIVMLPVVPRKAGRGSTDPKLAARIGVQGHDPVVMQGAGLVGIRQIGAEPVAIPARQAAFRADPEETILIFGDRRADGVWQTVILSVSPEYLVGEARPALLRVCGRARQCNQQQEHGEA
jgi:hypothetical protein